MPTSRRTKVRHLTTVKKKKGWKEALINDIRRSVEEYHRVFVFRYDNMRSRLMKELRKKMGSEGRFFMGRNKIIRIALGISPEDEHAVGIYRLSKHITGQCGILMTRSMTVQQVLKFFEDEEAPEVPKAKWIPNDTIVLEPGPLDGWQSSMMEQFRKLKMSVELKEGVIYLHEQYSMCVKGVPLTETQAKVLELFDKRLAVFRLKLACYWSRDGELQEYEEAAHVIDCMDGNDGVVDY